MKRRFLSLLLAVVLCVTTACAAGAGFSDVNSGEWYADAAEYCGEKGLLSAMPDGSFSPNTPATRAMLVMGLHRQAGSPVVNYLMRFEDVAEAADYAEAVRWAAGEGIVSGYSDTAFGPDDPVTREQFAAILWRSKGRPAPATTEAFADQEQIADYAVDAVAWAKGAGIIQGKGSNAFDPRAQITRAEAAVMLYQWEKNTQTQQRPVSGSTGGSVAPAPSPTPEPTPTPEPGGKTLVAYFSCTNNTENIAKHLEAILDADLYEIVPETPYSAADLNYNTDCRANQEQNDPTARPAISGSVEHMEQYDTVFLGYPIWWGQAPKILYTFLESYDFSGKTIVPFCTSGSSGIGSSATNLHSLADGATWLDGRRFSGSAAESDVKAWVDGLDLPKRESDTLYLKTGDTVWTATLADNSSAKALTDLLKQGDLTLSLHDYGNFEKVGPIGQTLPTNDEQITTTPGDLILYQGTNLCVYYSTNTWNFTRLGKLDDELTTEQMLAVLGDGDVSMTLSLHA